MSVNGPYRSLFSDATAYVGLDLEAGPGVDIVQEDPYRLPLDEATVDLVISGQMLEHCPHFWRVFTEVAWVLVPDGLAFMIAPSAGPIHRYPVDCYRFYPDAWSAVAEWADLRLVDCWLDERGPWRDLVGVFQKGNSLQKRTGPHASKATFVPRRANPDPAVEAAGGQRPYREILATLQDLLKPRLYCEIGVRKGHSLALCRGRAVAVDPEPELGSTPGNVTLYPCTSDDFFFFHAKEAFAAKVDLAFIDGMHLSDFVYRDFMNLERSMRRNGVCDRRHLSEPPVASLPHTAVRHMDG